MDTEFGNVRVMLSAAYDDGSTLHEDKVTPARVQIQTLKGGGNDYREVCIRMVIPASQAGELFEGIKSSGVVDVTIDGMKPSIKRAA